MSGKNHRVVAVCGALMMLLTVAMAMKSSVASTEPAPVKAQPAKAIPAKTAAPLVVVNEDSDPGCTGK
jgi:hypothetical protein